MLGLIPIWGKGNNSTESGEMTTSRFNAPQLQSLLAYE